MPVLHGSIISDCYISFPITNDNFQQLFPAIISSNYFQPAFPASISNNLHSSSRLASMPQSPSPEPNSAPSSPPPIDISVYVDQTAALMGLHLTPESRQGVIDNLERIRIIAQQVNDFPLPVALEAAPEFKP
jgi:hypothetical protein